jgi:ribosome biogenesis SPOUT family RNA methylase Rps3
MTDPLIDDVNALLDKEKGDERILKQIFRACENNEVISNYERNYVRKLAEKHLGKTPQIEENLHTEEKSITPDVIISKIPLQQKTEPSQTTYPRTVKLKSKNTKMLLGIGGAIFAIVIIIGVSLSEISFIESDNSKISIDSTTISIQTDLPTYQKGDIISISGVSNTSGKINLSIENQEGQLVWSEQIFVKSDNQFSTLAIAGGPGWNKSGTFTIKAENNLETTSKTFSFMV